MRRHLLLAALAAALLAGPTAEAQEQASLGFGVGLVKPSDVDSTFWVTANYRFRLADRLWLEPEAGYWEKTDDVTGVKVEDLDFGGNVILSFAGRTLDPWVGAGLGLHRIKFFESETQSELGIHLLGGLDYALSDAIALFGAGRFDLVSLEGDADLNQFKAYFGLRYKF